MHPQLPQTILAAAHHIVVERVHNDRHHRHGLTGHPLYLFIEVADVTADVQRPACVGPGEQADESAQMEHGQHGVLAHDEVRFVLIRHHVLTDLGVGTHHREEILLAQHHALAAARGTGGEHQDHQASWSMQRVSCAGS